MSRRSPHPYFEAAILLVLAIGCYVFFFHQLAAVGLVGPDEPRYASVALEMRTSGDYITPRLRGNTWFEKPPLMYWAAAAGYALAGVNEWGARLGSAFGATLAIFAVYFAGRKLWNWQTGFTAALITASSVGFVAFARAASTDMLLTASLSVALVCFVVGSTEASALRRWLFYGFYAALGLGVLSKGPVAFVLPFASLFLHTAVRGRWKDWKTWHPEGLLIALAVALPWYIACYWANGYEFFEVFIINQNLHRFTTEIHGHSRPFYFYGPVLLMLTFPWTFLLIPVLRRRWTPVEQLLGWWIVVPIIFFSFSGAKLPAYILPILPAVALLIARELANPERSRTFSIAVFIEAGTLAFIGVAFGWFEQWLSVDAHVEGLWIAAAAFSLAAGLTIIALWMRPVILTGFNTLMMALVVLASVSFVLPRFDRTETARPWKEALAQIARDDQIVYLYKPTRGVEYGLQFYRRDYAQGLFNPGEFTDAVNANGKILCIAPDSTLIELSRLNFQMDIVETIGSQTAFWASKTQ